MNAVECLSCFTRLLGHYAAILDEAVAANGRAVELPPFAMQRAFRFGRRTLEATQRLLPDKEHVLLTHTLLRAFYELSMRLLWASRESYGWDRFEAYTAREDQKWAREAREIDGIKDDAEKILAVREEVLARTDESGKPFEPAPDMKTVLGDIEKRDIAEGHLKETGGAAFQYTNVYRILCRPAHGHILAIEDIPADIALLHAVWAAGLATFGLLRAFTYMTTASREERDAAIDDFGGEILDVLRDARELRLVDTDE